MTKLANAVIDEQALNSLSKEGLPYSGRMSLDQIATLQERYSNLLERMVQCPETLGALVAYLDKSEEVQRDVRRMTTHGILEFRQMEPEIRSAWSEYSQSIKDSLTGEKDVQGRIVDLLPRLKLTTDSVDVLVPYITHAIIQSEGGEKDMHREILSEYRSVSVELYTLFSELKESIERRAHQIAAKLRGIDPEDLAQEGWINLYRAFHKFEPERGWQFSTYAMNWASAGMYEFSYDNLRTIRLPVWVSKEVGQINRYIADTVRNGGIVPSNEELLAIPNKDGNGNRFHPHAIAARGFIIASINTPLEAYAAGSFSDLIIDSKTIGPVELAERGEDKQLLLAALPKLDDRRRFVLDMRYGLGGKDKETLETIAERLGITRGRVRQIQNAGVGQLLKLLNESKQQKD